MNAPEWISQIETALTALENAASTIDQPQPLAAAATQLGQLTVQFGQLSVTGREQIRPQLTRLLGRINAAAMKIEQSRTGTAGELEDLRHHGQALNAYLVSNAKNRL